MKYNTRRRLQAGAVIAALVGGGLIYANIGSSGSLYACFSQDSSAAVAQGGWHVTPPASCASGKAAKIGFSTYVYPNATTTTTSPTTNPPPPPTTTTTTTPPNTTPPTTVVPGQKVVFEDQFNGTSVDRTKWELGWFGGSGPVNGSETACYDPSLATESGGYLHLTAEKSTICGKQYATGFVDTNITNGFLFTTGTLTARVYTPPGSGALSNWPAVWTDGTGTWPATGESDIMEGLGGRAQYHYHYPGGGPGGGPSDASGQSGWHTYSEVVSPGSVTYYYDGNAVGTVSNSTVGNFPHFIILGNQMGSYGGALQAPADMAVDWIQVTVPSNARFAIAPHGPAEAARFRPTNVGSAG